jgi:D-tyrosyl-tRNA(Tyr) deacylase
MRVLLQRVSRASVQVDGKTIGEISRGILLFVGVHQNDTEECAETLAMKCAELRIFPDSEGKMNLSCQEIGGSALVISQFTLYGDCHKGRRPNFMEAARPEKGRELYEIFVERLRVHLGKVETGEFGAMMKVDLVNDGPVTLILEKGS